MLLFSFATPLRGVKARAAQWVIAAMGVPITRRSSAICFFKRRGIVFRQA